MKLKANTRLFREALSNVASIIPHNSPMEMLKNVHVGIVYNGIQLTGSNVAVTISSTLSAEYTDGTELVLPAAKMLEILRTADSEFTSMSVEDQRAEVRCGRSVFRIPLGNADEYPKVKEFAPKTSVSVDAEKLSACLRGVVFATGRTETSHFRGTNYAVGGVLFHLQKDQLNLVATDLNRVAVFRMAIDYSGPEQSAVVPESAIRSYLKVGAAGAADIAFSENAVQISAYYTKIIASTLVGAFPKYSVFLSDPHPHSVDVVVAPLIQACQQVQVLTSDETRSAVFTFKDGELQLRSETHQGTSEAAVPISWNKPPMSIRLDPRLVSEALKTLPEEKCVTFRFTDAESRLLMECEGWVCGCAPIVLQESP